MADKSAMTVACTASCGCGFKAQTSIDGNKIVTVNDVVLSAYNHSKDTGHACEFHGMVRREVSAQKFVYAGR